MKNILFLTLITFTFITASCRKERSCECKTTTTEVRTGSGAGTFVTNTSSKITKDKQRKGAFKQSQRCYSQSYTSYDIDNTPPNAHSSTYTVEDHCELN